MMAQLEIISGPKLLDICGGSIFGLTYKILEAAHMIVGLREFINYAGERLTNGCQKIEEKDHFTTHICRLF